MSELGRAHGQRTSSRHAVVAALALVLCLFGATVASAAFTDREAATLTLQAATLQPPASVAAAPGTCAAGVSDAIVLSWTASATTAVTGYEILRAGASAGPYSPIGVVTGRTVQTYTDTPLPFVTMVFQLVSRRYERGSVICTSNKAFGEWGSVFGDDVLAAAILDRFLHHCDVVSINGPSYRLKDHLAVAKGGGPLE